MSETAIQASGYALAALMCWSIHSQGEYLRHIKHAAGLLCAAIGNTGLLAAMAGLWVLAAIGPIEHRVPVALAAWCYHSDPDCPLKANEAHYVGTHEAENDGLLPCPRCYRQKIAANIAPAMSATTTIPTPARK